MRILVFVKKFAAPTLTFIYNEVEELSKLAEVKIITLERVNPEKFPFKNIEILKSSRGNVARRILHPFQTRDWLWSYRDASVAKQIETIIENFKPDIIHTHFGYESWWFLANLKPQKIKVFISFHGFDASHKLNSGRYLKAFNYFNKKLHLYPIFVSEFMAKSVEAKTGNLPRKSILFYGTDVAVFKRTSYNHQKAPFVFLQISSFAEKKGHEYTIQAFSELLKKNLPFECRLILAGEGQLKNKMTQLVADLGISQHVLFPGLVNVPEAKNLMEHAHVFVHHSITSEIGDKEGIPNALMEAMAMELPVISTYHSGIPELVENNVNGKLVAEKDIKAYTEAMYSSLGYDYFPQNRLKILDKFEKTKHASQLLDIYSRDFNINAGEL